MKMDRLLEEIKNCQVCRGQLPLGPRPIVQAHPSARLVLVGQAPGLKVHQSGIPWDDASGDRLRSWLGLSKDVFYDRRRVAIVPIGFCYPGKGKSGDLPPRKECLPLWHERIFDLLPNRRLTLLIGNHAQAVYLKGRRKSSLTETVRAWKDYLPEFLPLPHPSPLNNIWLHKHPWFPREVLTHLPGLVERALDEGPTADPARDSKGERSSVKTRTS